MQSEYIDLRNQYWRQKNQDYWILSKKEENLGQKFLYPEGEVQDQEKGLQDEMDQLTLENQSVRADEEYQLTMSQRFKKKPIIIQPDSMAIQEQSPLKEEE